MPTIPIVDVDNEVVQMLPSAQRLPYWKIFVRAVVSQVKRLNYLFQYYMDGSIDTGYYSALVSYNKGDLVRTIDGVYESLANSNLGNAVSDTTYWLKVLGSFIGADERVAYNGRKLTFEYALNRYFNTTFRQPDDPVTPTNSDIYIDNVVFTDTSFVMYPDSARSSKMYPDTSTGYLWDIPVYASITTYQFNINIPLAVFLALGSTNPIRESIVRQFADKYCVSGLSYNIVTY